MGITASTNITPGEYVLSEIQPANYNSISDYDTSTGGSDNDGQPSLNDPDNEIAVTLAPNESDADNNFVEDPFTGIISGSVRDDQGNGIVGVVVTLYGDANNDGNEDGVALATTSTNGTGNYSFSGIEPGTYVVVETSPFYYIDLSDYDQTISGTDLDGDDSAQGADNDIPVILIPGETDGGNIFTDGRPGTVCGSVHDNLGQPISSVVIRLYHDLNNNDIYDGGDILVATTSTDGDTGNYCFEDVTPGEYVVVETDPANYYGISDYDTSTGVNDPDGNDQADGSDNQIPVTLVPGEQDEDNNFIDAPFPGSISGTVVDDAGNPIVGVTLNLYGDSNNDGNEDGSIIGTAVTNSSGAYTISGILPGHYVVVEISPLYYSSISDYDHTTTPPDTDGDDSAQGPDDDIPVIMTPGELDLSNDFVDGRPGTICGFVHNDLGNPMSGMQIQLYRDLNGNGNMDAGEPMIAVVYTDGDTGGYCFEDVVPGNYVINEIQIPTYGNLSDVDETPDPDGDDSVQGPDNNIPVVLNPNEQDGDNDFVDIICRGHLKSQDLQWTQLFWRPCIIHCY
jgi:protocatechuate 3,4-dioxygenase beta subunit